MMVVVQLLEIGGLTLLLVVLMVYAIYQSVPQRIGYIPLPRRAVAAAITALAIPPDSPATLVDLGCGDGRILAAALRGHPQLHGLGVEINPPVAALARWHLRGLRGRARIIRGDLFKANLGNATRVFTYLNHPTVATLEAKFERELAPGSRVVACDFPLPTRKPTTTVKIGEAWQLGQTLYIYEY
jgi:SAM-dependent methyltransferase